MLSLSRARACMRSPAFTLAGAFDSTGGRWLLESYFVCHSIEALLVSNKLEPQRFWRPQDCHCL